MRYFGYVAVLPVIRNAACSLAALRIHRRLLHVLELVLLGSLVDLWLPRLPAYLRLEHLVAVLDTCSVLLAVKLQLTEL